VITVFISYGGPDEEFARRINRILIDASIKTFFFPDSAKPGEKLHRVMRDNINSFDKTLFICSEGSLNRPGVLNELEETLQREAREGGEQILIPINLDDYVFTHWDPPRSGLKQAILDRVVGNFIGAAEDDDIFFRSMQGLLAVFGSSLTLTIINSEVILDLNNTGDCCIVTMRRTFVAFVEKKEILYSGLNSTGTITPVSTSYGRINPMTTEGGNKAIVVVFDKPLPVNRVVTHSLTVEHKNAFIESIESYSVHRMNNANKFSITVNFPDSRPVKEAYLKYNESSKESMNSDIVYISPNRKAIHFEIENPIKGSYYNLVWSW